MLAVVYAYAHVCACCSMYEPLVCRCLIYWSVCVWKSVCMYVNPLVCTYVCWCVTMRPALSMDLCTLSRHLDSIPVQGHHQQASEQVSVSECVCKCVSV